MSVTGASQRVVGFDPLNGVEQELRFEVADGMTHVRAVMAKDYPLLLRFIA